MNIKKHLRPILGTVALIIGIVFFIIPIIPVLGVAGLFAGAFLLAPYIPFLNRFKDWLKKKDTSGNTEKTEQKLNEMEEKYGQEQSSESDEDSSRKPEKDRRKVQ